MTVYQQEFNAPGTGARVWLRMEVTAGAQDVLANTTVVNWRTYLYKTGANTPTHAASNTSLAKVNGDNVYNISNHGYSFTSANPQSRAIRPTTLGNFNTKTVTHNEDGTKTVVVYATYADDGTQIIGTATIPNTNFVLPKISQGPKLKVAGAWKDTVGYIKVAGVWKKFIPYVKVGGAWKLLSNL